jgi:hypothetical protein
MRPEPTRAENPQELSSDLTPHIRLGMKDLQGTNTLAFLSKEWMTEKKVL